MKIAEWNIGSIAPHTMPWAYFSALVQTENAWSRPVIEMRASADDEDYQNQTLVSKGIGRTYFIGQQVIRVVPVPSSPGQSYDNTGLPWSSLWINAWMYDANNQTLTSGGTNGTISSGVFLIEDAT